MESLNNNFRLLSQEVIQKAVVENYESIYAVNLRTFKYYCFHQSDSFSTLKLDNEGDDFFADLRRDILSSIYFEDRDFVFKKLSLKAITDGFSNSHFYSFIYRLMIDGKPLYHKLRAIKEHIDGEDYLLIGIRNVDTAFRQDKAQSEALSSMHQKEKNHMEAILMTAAGYLEANLTQNEVLEISPYVLFDSEKASAIADLPGITDSYCKLVSWFSDNLVVENKKKFIEISDRDYLINLYRNDIKRASVSFTSRYNGSPKTPCRMVFYLYQDNASEDILSFCVIYDLTEQQRKEKELEDLERKLQMSRIRNFSSQMQPHFLYNALGSIQEIILDDPEYAAELLGDFTIHLRGCIRAMNDDSLIPFEKELENIRAYINIEKMRLGEKLKVVYDVEMKDFSILPLSVQPLVENAIRHGIYQRGKSGGSVLIKTYDTPDNIVVVVEDTGVGFDVEKYLNSLSDDQNESTGLKNLMFRLDKVMHARVNIQSVQGSGTTVEITIPKTIQLNQGD